MKKILIILSLLFALSFSSFSQERVLDRHIDVTILQEVDVKYANLNFASGLYADYVSRRGSGFGTKFTYGRQYSIAGSIPIRYWSLTAGYVQNIFNNNFTMYVGGGAKNIKEDNNLNTEYTVPLASFYLTWNTKAYGFNILAGTDIGFVNSNLYKTQPSNFPVTVLFGIGWDFNF